MPHSSPTRLYTDAAAPQPPSATAPAWQLRLLGSFELSDGTQRLNKLVTRAAMALLARLALRPGATHPREELSELLWPGTDAERGRKRLRQTLSTLRQVLEPAARADVRVLDADHRGIRLLPGTLQCDAVAFEQAYKRGDHDQAHALYGGEFLPGHFDEWICDERLRLEGLFDRLRPLAVPATPPPPTPTAAPPPPAVAAAPAGPRHLALPTYLSRMVGADPQAVRLKSEVLAHRLVTLMGPGGAGKTRLAVEVAHVLSVAPAWQADADAHGGGPPFDLVVFVPLAGCNDGQQMLDQVLLSLRLGSGKAGATAAVVQALDGRRTLLVLDNFEQLVDGAAEQLAELAARLPMLHLLVTSRRALALPGEREVVVETLALPAPGATLAEAALSPAVALFVDRAAAARAGFSLQPGNHAAVVELVQLLEGMPLAIELAGARARSMSAADMAATLRQARASRPADASATASAALGLLSRPAVAGRQDTRHHSMQDTIAWSWRLLAPQAQALLAALTVFQGGFSAAAAQAVCAGPDANGDGVDRSALARAAAMPQRLDELLSHSLLRAVPAPDDAQALRFSMYEPIREFAAQTLRPGQAAALQSRHRAWAVAWCQSLPATPPLIAIGAEFPNLVAAMVSAVADGDPRAAIDIAQGLRPALDELELPSAGQAALEAAAEACKTDTARQITGLTLLGAVLFRAGRGEDSQHSLARAIALAGPAYPVLRARALTHAAGTAWFCGERGPVLLAQLDEAEALGYSSGDATVLVRIDSLRADILSQRDGQYAQAEALLHRALARWQALGDRINVLRMRYCLACLAHVAGRFEDACRQIDPIIDEARTLQAWSRLAQSYAVRGVSRIELRQWPAARADLTECLRIAWGAMAMWNVTLALVNLPLPLVGTGQPVQALQLAGFATDFVVQRFGALPPDAVRELRRMRRLARHQVGGAACNAALAAGQQLTLAEAVGLALRAPDGD